MSNDDGSADVVDFDALNAALGDPPQAPPSAPAVAASEGRAAAVYASARPHTIPPTRAPAADDVNAPAVIVADEVHAQPVPLAHANERASGPERVAPPPAAGLVPPPPPPPPVAHPSQNQVPVINLGGSTPPSAFTPAQPFQPVPVQPPAPPIDVKQTQPMVGAPLRAVVRMPRNPTMVVPRKRGPNRTQKMMVFMSMLVVFVAGGIAALLYYRPDNFGLDRKAHASATASAAISAVPPVTASAPVVPPPPSVIVSAAPLPSVTAAPPPTTPPPRRRPKPQPTVAPPPPPPPTSVPAPPAPNENMR